MDPRTWPDEKDAAKALYGKPARLLVAVWALERGEPFFLQEAQDAIKVFGEAATATSAAIATFEALGMLSRYPDGRRVYFTLLGHPYWRAYLAMGVAFRLIDERTSERLLSSLVATAPGDPIRVPANKRPVNAG